MNPNHNHKHHHSSSSPKKDSKGKKGASGSGGSGVNPPPPVNLSDTTAFPTEDGGGWHAGFVQNRTPTPPRFDASTSFFPNKPCSLDTKKSKDKKDEE